MSPLLEVNITGARGILFNVTGGSDLGLFEVNEAAEVIKEAADPEANIIFGTVIDDRMRDEVKVTVIATGFDSTRKKPKQARYRRRVRPVASSRASTSAAARSWPRSSATASERASLEDQMGTESPFARPSEREATEVRPAERQPVPVRPSSLERPSYGDTDLDIPSFLRRKNDWDPMRALLSLLETDSPPASVACDYRHRWRLGAHGPRPGVHIACTRLHGLKESHADRSLREFDSID